MKLKRVAFYSILLAAFFMMPGCSDSDDDNSIETTWARYKVGGTVLDGETLESVKGIRVVLVARQDEEYLRNIADTAYTDSKGRFDIELNSSFWEIFHLLLVDVDGPLNGSYGSELVEVTFKASELKGGEGWFMGEIGRELGNIRIGPPSDEDDQSPDDPDPENPDQ